MNWFIIYCSLLKYKFNEGGTLSLILSLTYTYIIFLGTAFSIVYSYLTIYITAFFLTQVTAAFPSLVPRFVTLIEVTIVFAVSPHKTCLFLSVFSYFCVFLYRADGMSHVYVLLNSSHHFSKLKLYF